MCGTLMAVKLSAESVAWLHRLQWISYMHRVQASFHTIWGSGTLISSHCEGTSTTNASTAIDCVWSNFSTYVASTKYTYCHHKALICVPEKKYWKNYVYNNFLYLHVPLVHAASLPSWQMSLQKPLSRVKFVQEPCVANDWDTLKIKVLLSFVRQGISTALGKRARTVRTAFSHI